MGYLALSRFHLPIGLIVLYLFYLVRGYATPVLKDYINRITASHMRATVLSVRNFIIRFLFALTGPLLGWVKDIYSLPQALLLAGIIFLSISLLTAILFISTGKEMEGIRDYTSRTKPS
jgi:hypothetical protein